MSDTRVVWKYTLMGMVNAVEMPAGAELLTVGKQGEMPQLWALVDPNAPRVKRMVAVYGTGIEIDLVQTGPLKYVTTFFTEPFVWHVFDGGERPL